MKVLESIIEQKKEIKDQKAKVELSLLTNSIFLNIGNLSINDKKSMLR
jgi:hypothetical protein